ncbi:MAG: NlpC/P60 family protein [Lentisphaeria bacterium]
MGNYEKLIDNAIAWALKNRDRRDYQYKCLAFVEDAYEQGNALEMFGGSTATESAEQYGTIPTACPPRGALVFYSATGPINGVTKNWGHVGLCLGNNQVIHTWDVIRIDDYTDVEKLKNAPGWTPLHYVGWTAPEVFLKGFVHQRNGP